MIDVHEAVRIARAHLDELLGQENVRSVLLEEVELSDDDAFWRVTLSFLDPEALIDVYPKPRLYKTFTIRRDDAKVISMKIRQFQQ